MITLLETLKKGTAYLEGKNISEARKHMELIVSHEMGYSRVELYMNFDRPMSEKELTPIREKMKQRAGGKPLQHVLGTCEFFRREFKTDSRALIPRPETEELLGLILDHDFVRKKENPPGELRKLDILDMGTGSGVLGISLALELGAACRQLTLADISKEALSLAKENAKLLGLTRYSCIQTDLFSELSGKKFHIICANLPYVALRDKDSLAKELQHEPPQALFGGQDGLDILQAFIQKAPTYMHKGALLAMEIGHNQDTEITKFMKENGMKNIQTLKDINGIARFPIATLG